jgi:hypothetical protein
MASNPLFETFCDIFENLVGEQYDDRYYVLSNRARTIMQRSGLRLSKPFKENEVILEMRDRPVIVTGRQGTVNCDGTTTGKRPRTGAGTRVTPC